jgi:hypothetical protein
MKKNNTVKQSLKKETKKTTKSAQESITIGIGLGDKASRYCVLTARVSSNYSHTPTTRRKSDLHRRATAPC